MTQGLKATLMVIGAAGVLLFAGACPRLGAEAVYRSGAMLAVGTLAGLLALYGSWKLAAGYRANLIVGAVSLFFLSAGLGIIYNYSAKAWEFLTGGQWVGAVGMLCFALMGLIFMLVFGYLAYKSLRGRIWAATAHLAFFFIMLGGMIDFFCEERGVLQMTAGGPAVREVTTEGRSTLPLDFELQLLSTDIQRTGEPTYTLYTYQNNRWVAPVPLAVEGNTLRLGEETWNRELPGGQAHLLLPGSPMRLIVRTPAPVSFYDAECRLTQSYRGTPTTETRHIRVNTPLECKGWQISLLDMQETPAGGAAVMQARRAPGRGIVLAGLVGLIISTCGMCWQRKPSDKGKEAAA